MTPSDTLAFTLFLLDKAPPISDLDDLPADLGEFVSRFGYDQLLAKLTTERKKIRHWRNMDAVKTLARIKENLEDNTVV